MLNMHQTFAGMSCTSTQSSPFSKLPPELVQSIVELTVTPIVKRTTYTQRWSYFIRRSTLRSLCLVSKKFHQIAKPLLFAVVHFRESGQYRKWKEEGGDLTAHLHRDLFVELTEISSPQADVDLESLVRSSVGLRALHIEGGPFSFDLSMLNCLPSESTPESARTRRVNELAISLCLGLVTLYLSGAATTMSCAISSRVQEVTLSYSTPKYPLSFSEILKPTSFPDLRVLALEDTYYHDGDATMLNSFGPQIDVLVISAYEFRSFMDSVEPDVQEKTLFAQSWLGDWDHHFPHLRLGGFDPGDLNDEEDRSFIADETATKLSQIPTGAAPRLLYLPSPLATHYDIAVQNSRLTIKGVSEQRKIEIVFEEEGESDLKSLISDDFRRRTKERKLSAAGVQ
ncbi:hypothetical protein JCM3765_000631 [Sporobolomyces pararoseus]